MAYQLGGHMMDSTTTEKLIAELNAVVRDAEALMKTVAAGSGEHLREAGESEGREVA